MYVPIYQLTLYDYIEAQEAQDRWQKNSELHDYIIDLIRKGAGEDFLQWDFERGKLKGFLRDMWDLRGILFQGENITFPDEDNFETIDFSYGQFYNSTFINCYFRSTFNFARLYGCKFINCTFHFTTWLGCSIEKCKFEHCDFIEYTSLRNCDIKDSSFKHYFSSDCLFDDCRFDSNCIVADPELLPNGRVQIKFDVKQFGDFFTSISEAYKAGGIYDKGRKYFYMSRKARTCYNSTGLINYFLNKLNEMLTGYGVKPLRPIINLLIILFLCSGIFTLHTRSIYNSIIISVSALFTMGDSTLYPFPYDMIYLAEGFLGIVFLGFYLTVLANVWFSQR